MKQTVAEHLHDRWFEVGSHIWWADDREHVATFPLMNGNYQMVGYQQYRPNASKKPQNNPKEGRYYTYQKNEDKIFGVWGMETWRWSNTLYITEGIFDACRVTYFGHSAIATISNDPKHLSKWLWLVRQQRPVVAICDDGNAGKKLAKYAHVAVTVPGGDLGDAHPDYVWELLNEYSF